MSLSSFVIKAISDEMSCTSRKFPQSQNIIPPCQALPSLIKAAMMLMKKPIKVLPL